ncbi:MAG: glycosyltransferase [Deltaproteobacteria bacterium]|nr:glycosyltransferase [Deltaproteobacteria bacterium]
MRSVGVIVPTYHRAGSLKKLLESFDALEIPNSIPMEVPILDNGSTDGTETLLAQEETNARKAAGFFRITCIARKFTK